MPLEKIEEVPKFDHGLSDYFLAQLKSESDREAVKTYFALKRGLEWNNQATVTMNNAVVDLQSDIGAVKDKMHDWEEKMKRPMEILFYLFRSPLAVLSFIAGTAITAYLSALFQTLIK